MARFSFGRRQPVTASVDLSYPGRPPAMSQMIAEEPPISAFGPRLTTPERR